jgi:hypothetical protein
MVSDKHSQRLISNSAAQRLWIWIADGQKAISSSATAKLSDQRCLQPISSVYLRIDQQTQNASGNRAERQLGTSGC